MPTHTPVEQFLQTLDVARQERQRRPAPGDVEAFPGLTSTLDSLSAILQAEQDGGLRRGRPLPEGGKLAGLTNKAFPNQMRLAPGYAEDRGVIAHEAGHLMDFRDVPAAERAREAIPEGDMPTDRDTLTWLLDQLENKADSGPRGEVFANEFEQAFFNVDRDTDDEIQQTLRELLHNRLAQGERRARERTRFTRDATAVRR